jgi:hypothetical protein
VNTTIAAHAGLLAITVPAGFTAGAFSSGWKP